MKRIKISAINAFSGVVATIVEIIALLILKQKFVAELGDSLYGLDQFVKNVVSAFSLAELGVGSVIGFSLYKPIARGDHGEIIALMQFYKRIYSKIGLSVLTLGILFMPFILNFVKEYKSNLTLLYLTYLLFLLNSFLSYFFSYNKTLITSTQKSFVLNFNRIFYCIFSTFFLIFAITSTHNYIFYLAIWVIMQVCENLSCYIFAKKKYWYFFSKKEHKLSADGKNKMNKNIKALVAHRVGGVLVLGSDGIIVPLISDLNVFGFFSNYVLIVSSVHKVLVQIFDGIRASFGDFVARKEKTEAKKFFLILQTLAFIIYTWSSVFILNLCQPFVELWMGKGKQLSFLSVILFVFNFYLRGLRLPIDLIKDVSGIYWQDRYKPIAESIVKIVFSLILSLYFGYIGVILGTTLSFVFVLFTVEPYIVYKYAFGQRVFSYYLEYLKYFIFFLIICLFSFLACRIFDSDQNLISLISKKFAVSLLFPPLFFVVLLRKTYEFKFLKNTLKTCCSRTFENLVKFFS
ncbi:MAG: hypothetical protein LBH37_00280 [Oscillospiraceae bacterium]|jgi:O-antigen/teichoic acid export membrane protein|nr:hypothetical protein [Oscillospiraceae bacterium]